jgi:hypothetical protein
MTPQYWKRIQKGIFAGESGGDYNALFNYQNRPDGRFAGVDLQNMTIDQALDFANPSGEYGQYVKGQVGHIATPMGAYQIVGSTLRDAKRGLDLKGDELMTPEMQDRLGQWIYKKQGTGAWAGYKPEPNAQDIADQTMTALGKGPRGILAAPELEAQPMIANQQPQGLLGSLGVQKMQPGAEGETGQRFYERDTFKDTAARMAQGFAALGGNPAVQKFAADVAAQRTEGKARNKTVDYLRKAGRTDLADMVAEGLISGRDAAGAIMQQPAQAKGVAVDGKLVNPVTGAVIYEDTSAPSFEAKDVSAARKEFTSLPAVKDFSKQTAAYGRIMSSLERNEGQVSPAADLALIFNYMKVLDPGSTVREGEFKTAAKAGSFGTQIAALVSQVESGELLTASQRADFADRATRLYQGAENQYRALSDQYGQFATERGLPVERVIPDFGFSGTLYEMPLEFRRPPAPDDVSADDWARAWSNMTDNERREALGGGQ